MKKIYLLFAGISAALMGCKKDYSCSCTYTYTYTNTTTGATATSSYTEPNLYVVNGTKGKAREQCESFNYTNTSTYTDGGVTYTETYGRDCTID